MPKYRLLNQEELHELEEEFIEYLIVNGITAEDWERLKQEQKEEAEKIINLFSDVVFESLMRKTKYLELWGRSYVQFVRCGEEKMQMIALKPREKGIDLSKPQHFEQLMRAGLSAFEVFEGSKAYQQPREEELFALTEKGYILSDGQHYEALRQLLT